MVTVTKGKNSVASNILYTEMSLFLELKQFKLKQLLEHKIIQTLQSENEVAGRSTLFAALSVLVFKIKNMTFP